MALPWRLFPQPASQALLGPHPSKTHFILITQTARCQAGKNKTQKTIKKNSNRTFLSSLPIINFFQSVYALFPKPP